MKKFVFCHGFPYHRATLLPLALSFEAFYGFNLSKYSNLPNFMKKSFSLNDIGNNLNLKENILNHKVDINKKEHIEDIKNNSGVEIINLDLGYFDDSFIIPEKELNGAIAIGHGIGFNKLLDMNVSWKAIVGVSTLFKFVYNEESKRKIENLENSINTDAELALKSMVGRLSNNEVSISLPYGNINKDLIKQDIEYIKNIDSSKVLNKKNIPSLFLHGSKDIWCNVEEAKKQFKNYNFIVKENSSHILGYLNSMWCRDNIIKLIEEV